MKRLIATVILAIIAIAIAGCDFTYEHVHHRHHGPGPGPIVVVRRPVYHPPHGHGQGHHPGRNWRRH